MENIVVRVHIDRAATRDNILLLAKKKGFSVQEFNRLVKDVSARYRCAAGKSRLSEIDRYAVFAQVLDVRLDDLFVVSTN